MSRWTRRPLDGPGKRSHPSAMLNGSEMPGTIAPHVSDAARGALELTDAHRIALIDRDLWIGYSRAGDAHARLERILRSERRMRPDNLLIVGTSNNGKTAIARRFLARHTAAEKSRPRAKSHRDGADPGIEWVQHSATATIHPHRAGTGTWPPSDVAGPGSRPKFMPPCETSDCGCC